MKEIKTENAVGYVLCHDITQIIKDEKKGVLFKKGHIVKEEDIPLLRLQSAEVTLHVGGYQLAINQELAERLIDLDNIYRVLNRFLYVHRTDILMRDNTHCSFQVLRQSAALFVALKDQERVRKNDTYAGYAQRNSTVDKY